MADEAKKAMGDTKIDATQCKLPACLKRCEDDHNESLKVCDLSEGYAMYLFVLSIVFMGGISRFCYMCCSKHSNSPQWVSKHFLWLNLWIGLTTMILIGWIWDMVFALPGLAEMQGLQD